MCFDLSFNYVMSLCVEQLGLVVSGNLFYEFNDNTNVCIRWFTGQMCAVPEWLVTDTVWV